MSKEIVVDANVVASWFFPDEDGGDYDNLFTKLDKVKLHAPSIFVFEFMNILLIALRKRRITDDLLTKIIDAVSRLPISIFPISSIISDNESILSTARKHKLTSYDSAYLELAIRLGGIPLITYDKELIAAAKREKLAVY